MPYTYRMVLTWSENGQRWIAEAPELPWTAADGQTPEEAISNVQTLISEWLMVATDQHREIPRPRTYEQYENDEEARDQVGNHAETHAVI